MLKPRDRKKRELYSKPTCEQRYKLMDLVKKHGMSIGKASAALNIKYSTARDIMTWVRKHGRPYRSSWD